MSYDDYRHWRDGAASLDPALSVIIPAHDEARRIVPTIAAVAAHLATSGLDFEIIISDDGSTDGTPDLVRSLGLRNLRVVESRVNRGKGAAVRAGVRAATGRLVLFTDADLSAPIEELAKLIDAVASGAGVAIGSRGAPGASEARKSPLRRLLSGVSRQVVRTLMGIDIADSQCGFKLFTREAARTLFAAQRTDGFSFDAEILFLAHRFGLRVIEVPVHWVDAPGSSVDPLRTSVAFVRDLLLVRVRALTGRLGSPGTGATAVTAEPGLRLAVVTALPPSTVTLTEYGHHLVERLSTKAEVSELIVLAEDSADVPSGAGRTQVVPSWTFDSPTTPLRLLAAVRRHRPDAVVFNLHFTSFGGRKIPAALGLCTPALLRLVGVPTLVLLHNIIETVDLEAAGFSRGRLHDRVVARIGRILTRIVLCADRVVTTMPAYVEILREQYGAENVYLTPHGSFDTPQDSVDDPRCDRPWPADDRRRILAFGKFGTYKKVDDLIAAYRTVRSQPGRFDDVELVIAGTDSPNAPGYLAGVAAANADLDGLRFTGYVAEDDVPALFEYATVVVFPYTATTGSSGPLHQAGAHARAVVAPRIGDFVDLLAEEGFEAACFEPGDVDGLAVAVTALLDDPEECRRMGRVNHAAALSLPLDDVADWHLGHLEALIAA
ncbi:MAG: glycosyltransferase [Actinomycetota bacterium]|nr:glycosyltransferase [Thermoleophilia bacterium]MDH5279030.1 glycosyltransferase [Actinomycetota bacterium]